MLVSLNLLKNFVRLKKELSAEELGKLFTLKSAEVDGAINEAESYENIVVGQILEIHPHENADKLKITKVSVGKETLQIVCGGTNIYEGMYVAVAMLGAKVKWHGEGDLITMEKAKIRGVESYGMICAGVEIGVEDDSSGEHGVLDLSALKPKVGTPLSELLEKNDIILEFDNKALTNRPDLWGHYGMARELAAISGGEFLEMTPKVKVDNLGKGFDAEVKEPDLCPRYMCLEIEGVEVSDSPAWLKKTLKKLGHGTHNNIVDITNYVMAELGQPLHAFDRNLIKDKIIVRKSNKGEKIITLDDKEKELPANTLLIADSEKPLAVAGIIGGKFSGINKDTASVVLESANFQAGGVRRSSRELGIRTDSLQRFEKSLDPELCELALKRATELILQLCPKAKIKGSITDIKNFAQAPKKIKLNIEAVNSKIGISLEESEIAKILTSLGFGIEASKNDVVSVLIPSYRATKDITGEDDLIEEVARIYGYDNIPATLPKLPSKLPLQNPERNQKHSIRKLLSLGLGFNEIYLYSFYGERELKNCLLNEEGHLKLLNYLSEEQTHLRSTLIPNILKNLTLNVKNFDRFKVFELGRTYKEIGEFYPLEEKKLAGAVVEKSKGSEVFYQAKGAVEAVLENIGVENLKRVAEVENAPYAHPKRAVTYLSKEGKTLAQLFMVHPVVQKNWELEKYSIALFEINFEEAVKQKSANPKYKPLPKYPSIDFDISLLINETVEVGKVQEAILKTSPNLISKVKLFDIYSGDKIEKGKKSLAFSISLSAPDKTLTDEDMNTTLAKIKEALAKLGATLRENV